MRLSRSFFKTLKEVPKEAQVSSHVLMLRAGMIQQVSSGIYSYLPLALRSLKKIEKIIREELIKSDCEEVLMPMVQPAELWQESQRWNFYGAELLRLEDRRSGEFCLGPTHEEVITDMVRRVLSSYKQLPWNLFQIQTKFRDEIRPRFGLMRGREFIMKDGYSFDVDEESAKLSYQKMYEAYTRIFERTGLVFRAVEAATGNIGGSLSHEFQVLAETGEDDLLHCEECGYAANDDLAELVEAKPVEKEPSTQEYVVVETPGGKSVEEACQIMGISAIRMLKTLIVKVDDECILAIVRGDKELNPAKLLTLFQAGNFELASEEEVLKITEAPLGSLGPVNLPHPVKIVVDRLVLTDSRYACGANQADKHLDFVLFGRDFEADVVGDISLATAGDRCPSCLSQQKEGVLKRQTGVEVAHIFHLGKKYSELMNCNFLDHQGKKQASEMGCYGIGVGRTMAAAIEQNHDERGIRWPMPIAPFEVVILPLQMRKQEVVDCAEDLYQRLLSVGWDVLLDDRDERPGVKFNDADLVGYPLQIIIGTQGVERGVVEFKERREMEKREISLAEVEASLQPYRENL